MRLAVTGERASSSRSSAAARDESRSVEPGIVSIDRPEPEPESVGTRSNADPAADVAEALRAAAAAVERAAALFARQTERATKEKPSPPPPPPPVALSSPRGEPEASGSAFRAHRE